MKIAGLILNAFLVLFLSSAFAQDRSQFAFDLYKKMAAKEGNFFISPFSISSVLTMTAAGAKGKTFRQLEKALYLSKDPSSFYLGLLPLEESENYELLIANLLLGSNKSEYSSDFLARL